jgi:hypothetical protein
VGALVYVTAPVTVYKFVEALQVPGVAVTSPIMQGHPIVAVLPALATTFIVLAVFAKFVINIKKY